MLEGPASAALRDQVQILFTAGTAVGLTDRDLLDRFLHDERESGEAAFRILVERHGPMVLRVCNQTLRDRHAAEDAFQATFLVLVRRARSIRKHDSVESWLFGVACRAAARIRMMEARRQRYERRGAGVRAHGDTGVPDSSEPWPALHAEIARLPEKYRLPIVLCYFEGLTHDQAAGRLGWPVGTVKTRLARARDQLRWRLGGRLRVSAPLIPTELVRPADVAEVPRLLLESTTRAAARFVSGAGEVISSPVLAITKGVLRAMLFNELRFAAITLFGVVAIGLGAMALARQAPAVRPGDGHPGPLATPANHSRQPAVLSLQGTTSFAPETTVRVHTPFDGRVDKVLVDLGSRVKKSDPLLELFSNELAEAKSNLEVTSNQWAHDKKVLDYKTPLVRDHTLPEKQLIEAENDEAQSRLKMKLAKDKLLVYGLTEEEIENAKTEEGVQKAKMILRSRGEGLVVRRNVVQGNYYTSKDELLVIARDDLLHVTAMFDPRDVGNLEVGQLVTVNFPFSHPIVNARVEAINPDVDSGKITLRTSIPNRDHRLKAGMFVRIGVELGPNVQSSKATDAPVQRKSNLSLDERLSEVERKLNLLLDEKHSRSVNAEILERLSELERKLDRALRLRTGK